MSVPIRPPTGAIRLPDRGLADRIAARLDAVERALAEAVTQADPLADNVSRHLLAAGGKRLRPFLTLLSAEVGDPQPQQVLDAAVVVELTHLATLYHDDVIDGAVLRRGAPAAHQVWGNTVAILVGDLLFAKASQVVAGLGPDAVRIQAETFERLCLGQLHETIGPRPDEDPVAHYLQVLADKTASLTETAARFGAMFAGVREPETSALAAYGARLGMAFQLADDVLDLTSSDAESGKTPGTDLRERVPTMPVLLLRRRVGLSADNGGSRRTSGSADDVSAYDGVAFGGTSADRALLAKLDGDLSDDATLAQVVAQLRQHPVVAETRALAARWAREAAAQLAPIPSGPVRDGLEALAISLADRAV